jgi:hypothetical protein
MVASTAGIPATLTHLDLQGLTYRIHSFDYNGFNIWGLTAGILIKVARVAFGRPPEFQEHSPRGIDYTRFW